MKIQTFFAYYTPEVAASLYLAENLFEDWAKNGHIVEVFVPTPTRGVDKETIAKYKKIHKEVLYDGHLVIHRFRFMQEHKNIILRALRYLLLSMKFFVYGLVNDADVMFIDSTPPTQGIIATFLKKITKKIYVYNLQDMFPDSLVYTGICGETSLLYKIGLKIEKMTYRNASKIITISEDFKKKLIDKGVETDKIEVVYNWVDENCVKYITKNENQLYEKYKLDKDLFYVAYSGNIGLTQNMEMLVDVAKIIQEIKPIVRFVIVGDGVFKSRMEELVMLNNLNNIIFIPFQPYDRISEVFSLGDVGLIISKKGVGNNSVPSKTWSYMAASRPILSSFDVESELVSIVKENECGICVDAGDLQGLVDAIVLMVDKYDCRWGLNGRKFVETYLCRTYGTNRYLKAIEEVVKAER